jgi:Fic family protein
LFVSIHPFSDGNGRTTRLLTQHLLQIWNYGFKNTLSLDSYYLQHQLEYYEALSRSKTFDGRMDADITPFLDFFTQGFLESVRTLQQYIEIGGTESRKALIRLNTEELSILDYAHQFGAVALRDVIDMLNIPRRTAQRRLQMLVSKGILEKFDQGPTTKYKIIINDK